MSSKRALSPDIFTSNESSTSNAPSKRVCTSNSSLSTPDVSATSNNVEPPSIRSEEFYFSGKMVVLIAENVHFRIHQDLLIRDSTIFADMFSLPGGDSSSEMVDGHPAVRLPDTAENWTAFLKSATSLQAPVMQKVLRAASKYMFDTIRKGCMRRLEQIFPSTLTKWDNVNIPQFPYAQIVVEHELLKPELLVKLFVGRDAIVAIWTEFISNNFTVLMDECNEEADGEACVASKGFWYYVTEVGRSMEGWHAPLQALKRFVDDMPAENLCAKCSARVSRIAKDTRKLKWQALPKMFNMAKDW
ncbi:hypothetical protein M422DRAFT_249346 [Sphaerobolus stellatus SS14]|uniref:BTB domain-containing protein n=1 Tax=Sphaerobolus stellatus (strain SS14) TaxID=990650 RepID=A0A0C9VVE4_SPHS4|nr:hypothetical protein M422DRAFT_249346 [Sphaerobolus stellatus SS14]